MSMVNTTTCSDYSSTVASLPMLTISSWVITSIEASNHLKLCASFSLIRLNIRRTSSYSEEITSVHPLTESMVFMTSASAATISSCGKLSLIVSIASLLLLLLMRKYFVCTVDSAPSSALSSKLRELWDRLMFLIPVFFAISCGQILIRMSRVGVKTTEVSLSPSVKKSFQHLTKSTILTWSAELIKSLKTAMSFSQRDNL
jgi:hypothetical protein